MAHWSDREAAAAGAYTVSSTCTMNLFLLALRVLVGHNLTQADAIHRDLASSIGMSGAIRSAPSPPTAMSPMVSS
jgi:hypothetical protein